jgi:peptide/nickel transport system permease protein
MAKFLIRRLGFMLLTMLLLSVAIFAISELAPGNIAINTLGNFITPEQEASFNAQNGLDQPPLTRYVRWMIGSDWQASRRIGRPVRRVYDVEFNRFSWWVVGEDGSLFQNYSPDGERMIRLVRQADGTTVEAEMSGEVWQPNPNGLLVYWGVDRNSRAALWVKGEYLLEWTLTAGAWTNEPGAPQEYIPLQKGILRADPGISFYTRRPVAETLFTRLINSGYLATLSFVIIMPLSLLLGLVAGLNEGKWIDNVLSLGGLVTTATPSYATGVFLILVFTAWLRVLPGAVIVSQDSDIFNNPKMLVLPVLTLTLIELGYVLRITRASMLDVMKTNYIRTAVLKGLPRLRIIFAHALKNALIAPITVITLHINWLVGGVVVVETIFGFPGLGFYVLQAALFKDVFAVEAAAMLLVIIAVGSQLVADLIYLYLNPRIRYA